MAFTPVYAPPAEVQAQVNEITSSQQQIDKAILAEYRNGNYDLDAPLVIQDPYGSSATLPGVDERDGREPSRV